MLYAARRTGIVSFPTYFFDAPSDSAGSGAPAAPAAPVAPVASPSSASLGTSASTPTDPTPPARVPTPVPGAPGAVPPAKKFEFAEDRSTWVDPSKFSAAEQRAQQATLEAQRYKAMVEAGTGIKFQPAAEPEDPAIVEARETILGKVFTPNQRKAFELIAADPARLERILTEGGQVIDGYQQQNQRQGADYIGGVFKSVATALGVPELSNGTADMVGAAFVQWVRADGTRLARYGRADASLQTEFTDAWRTGFIEPLRRVQQSPGAAQVRTNASLPAAPRAGGIPPSTRTARVPKTADDVHDNAWQQFVAERAAGH